MPDLVIDPGEAVFQAGKVTATVHNLGNGEARDITVSLLDGDIIVQEKIIRHLAAPTDFIPKRTNLTFDKVQPSKNLKVVVDLENKLWEILEENNSVLVK